MSEKKTKPILSYALLCVGAALLINPMPLLLDIFPDVIGFALMLLAVRRISNLVPEFDTLKDNISKLTLITAIKIPGFFLMVFIWGGDLTQRSIVAVFTLVFAVVELCFLIPFTSQLFSALGALGEHHGIGAALKSGKGPLAMRPDVLEKFTLAFFLIRGGCSCLPEMALVPLSDTDEMSRINWNMLYPIFAIVGAILTLVLGLIWCAYFISYIKRIQRDKEANLALCESYVETPYVTSMGKYRLTKLVGTLYIIAVICSFDITIDRMNFLPDILSALGLLAAAVTLFFLIRRGYPLLVLAVVYSVLSSIQTILNNRFFEKYDIADIRYFDPALAEYKRILTITLVTEIVLALLLFLFCYYLVRLAREEMGEEALSSRPIAKKTLGDLTRYFLFAAGGGALTAIASYFDRLTYLETKNLPSGTVGYITVPALDWFWVVPWILGIVWLGFSIRAFSRLNEEAELHLPER